MSRSVRDLSNDPTAQTAWHRLDDRFVPLRADDLMTALLQDAERLGLERERLQPLFEALRECVDRHAHALHQELEAHYALFNPDRDTQPLTELDALRTPERYAELDRRIEHVLNKANFEKLSGVEIVRVINAATSHGFKVRLNGDRIESLEVWVRGRGTLERNFRDWRSPWKGRDRTLRIYRRLVVVARLKRDPHVLVKMFKDIPEVDVEALLPHAEVQMNFYDRLMLFGSGAGALIPTLLKLLNLVAMALTQFVWALVVGLATLTFRTIMGYRRAHKNRDWQRTRNLYFQNLSNNAGTLHTLVAMISQEELKEALLAYVFCAGAHPGRVESAAHLGALVQTYLERRFSAAVDFDVDDALTKLTRLGLWQDRKRLQVLDPEAALERLGAAEPIDVATAP